MCLSVHMPDLCSFQKSGKTKQSHPYHSLLLTLYTQLACGPKKSGFCAELLPEEFKSPTPKLIRDVFDEINTPRIRQCSKLVCSKNWNSQNGHNGLWVASNKVCKKATSVFTLSAGCQQSCSNPKSKKLAVVAPRVHNSLFLLALN